MAYTHLDLGQELEISAHIYFSPSQMDTYLTWNGSNQNWENGTRSDYIPVNTGTI